MWGRGGMLGSGRPIWRDVEELMRTRGRLGMHISEKLINVSL